MFVGLGMFRTRNRSLKSTTVLTETLLLVPRPIDPLLEGVIPRETADRALIVYFAAFSGHNVQMGCVIGAKRQKMFLGYLVRENKSLRPVQALLEVRSLGANLSSVKTFVLVWKHFEARMTNVKNEDGQLLLYHNIICCQVTVRFM